MTVPQPSEPVVPAKKKFHLNPKIEIALGCSLAAAAVTALVIFKVQANLSLRDADVAAEALSNIVA